MHNQGVKKNKEYHSTLKLCNFEGMDKDQIINKYEQVLASREKQVEDLCIEIGSLNEKLSNVIYLVLIIILGLGH